ncbi:succinylglutamate desuccinylase/aspartoacylase family protein [Flagellimonas sp. GZD32]|uniref:succinylglutamate desuccinylase/aspartoacylase family protein n=1 Tax=Flagellimonas cixiensis TaxID=3228750 RepID=UPI0035C8DE3E
MKVKRVIDHIKGEKSGPTVVFFGGIHGNEPAGVLALRHVFNEIRTKKIPVRGSVYGLSGNLGALEHKMRFQKEDFNRIWFPDRIHRILKEETLQHPEELELKKLYLLIREILEMEHPPFYFLDLHTTSSDTTPFMVLNDSLLNRKYASNYPLPIILGIEEYLHGALLSHINELGYVSLGFESGQHDDPKAVETCIDFIWYSLMLTQAIPQDEKVKKQHYDAIFKASDTTHRFYEIYHQHVIPTDHTFTMKSGFVNFQWVPKGTDLAIENGMVLQTRQQRQIFMPLYQKQGNEGFYFIRPIPRVVLWLSKQLRRCKVDDMIVILPGVKWDSSAKNTLVVDLRIARFFAKKFFHLLGYRARQVDETHLRIKNRERASKTEDYVETAWF